MRLRVLATAVAVILTWSRARADEPAGPGPARRALAVGAALVPGVIVRGAGHWVADERRTARRLLALEGLGLAMTAAGGIPLGLSGGAEEAMPTVLLIVPGLGLLVGTLAADAWGAAGGAAIAGEPLVPDALAVGLGYTFVGDPRVPFGHLATATVDGRRGRALVAASGWLGDGTWRARGAAGVRVLGARAGERRADGSWIELELAAAEERRDAQGFAVTSVEVSGRARADLARVGPSLRGSFVSFAMGAGVERVRYAATGARDGSSLLSGRIGWGFVVGDGGARALEAELYYEHRRDDLAGGLTLPVGSNGFLGHVGATATAWRARWGLTATAEVGSAWILSLAARWRLPAVTR